MTFAPYWLMPAPWPLPETVKRKLRPSTRDGSLPSAARRSSAFSSPVRRRPRHGRTKRARSDRPSARRSSPAAGRRDRHPDMPREIFPGSSPGKLRGRDEIGTSEAVSGLETLTRYGTSPPPHGGAALGIPGAGGVEARGDRLAVVDEICPVRIAHGFFDARFPKIVLPAPPLAALFDREVHLAAAGIVAESALRVRRWGRALARASA